MSISSLPRLRSIRARLVLWNTLTLALLYVLMDVVLHLSVSAILMRSVDEELRRRTQDIVDFPPPNLAEDAFRDSQIRRNGRRPNPPQYRPLVIDPRGKIVKPPAVHEFYDAAAVNKALRGEMVYSTVLAKGTTLRVISRRFPREGPVQGVMQDAMPLADNFRIITTLDRAILWMFPVMLLCAGVGSALMTRRTLQQVRGFTSSAQQISASDLSGRLPVSGGDEFAVLATTFNAMLARLEISFVEKEALIENLRKTVVQQRRFTADASHELRTPLTAIKANTSLSLSATSESLNLDESRSVLEDIDQAATAMAHLVDDLLLLARSDEGRLGHNRSSVNLRDAIETAVSLAASGAADAAPIRLNFPEYPLVVQGNQAELIRLFTNLLSNAIRYTPGEGQIEVSASSGQGAFRIVVSDTGIGIAPRHLKQLGERFFRADTSRSRSGGGTGLGLSICQSIVNAYNGTLSFESSVGVGTTATVILPAVRG